MKTNFLKLILTLSTKLTIWSIEKLTKEELTPKTNSKCYSVTTYIHYDHINVETYYLTKHFSHKINQ